MNMKSTLFSISDYLRDTPLQDKITETVIVTTYLFWKSPEEAISAMQLGENNLRSYLEKAFKADELCNGLFIKDYSSVNYMKLYEEYHIIYQSIGEDRDAFANKIAEGIYSGMTMVSTPYLAGQCMDSTSIALLMSRIARLYPHNFVMDPASGLGRVLYLLNPNRFLAKEIMPSITIMAQLLFTMLRRNGSCEESNSLLNNGASSEADLVIAQPPFGMRIEGELYQTQPYLLVDSPLPSSGGDSLWIQESLYQASSEGRVIIQIPPGWLYRSGYDYAVRKALIERNWIEAIIYLPGHVLGNTAIEISILILNKSKKTSTIRLVNAKEMGKMTRLGKVLSDNEIDTITQHLIETEFDDTDVKEITLRDVIAQDYNFSPNIYFVKELLIDVLSVEDETRALGQAIENYQVIQKELEQLLDQVDKK